MIGLSLATLALIVPSLISANNVSSSNNTNPSGLPPLPATQNSTLHPYEPAKSSSFVTAKDGKLYLDGKDYTFASFNYPGLIGQDEFKASDCFRTFNAFDRPVTRSYTLGVSSVNVKNESAFVQGWSNETQDWVYNEDKFVQFDQTLVWAREWGVRFIVPIINQDYGSQDTNYASLKGNWADLIRLYYGLDDYNQTKPINFWTDPNMIEATKKLYTKVLTRNNTLNGIVYGQDETFLAIETGNEMNYNMTKGDGIPDSDFRRPPPGSWTHEIAKHIKSLAPNILVMDGTLSRANKTEDTWAEEALTSPYVDLYSNHYYDYFEPSALNFYKLGNDSNWIRKYGKTFVIGEHGFYPTTEYWRDFIRLSKENPVAGSLVWGLRAHVANGGFETHGEGKGIFSYHAPGWSPPAAADFDPLELFIIREIYKLSYDILGDTVPSWPVPNAPEILPLNQTSNGTSYFPFGGGSWAEHYEVFHHTPDSNEWTQVGNFVRDNVDAGQANYTIQGDATGDWIMRGVSVDLIPGEWSQVVTV